MSVEKIIKNIIVVIAVMVISGCAGINRVDLVPPKDSYETYQPVGIKNIVREFGDVNLDELYQSSIGYEKFLKHLPMGDGLDILALSGGGADGAFGAGVLYGWTENGDRPEFDIVTGVSTGALIAPFAFLGSEYDHILKKFYTQTETDDIAKFNVFNLLFSGGHLANTRPLANTIKNEITDDLIRKIAVEYRKGRELLISTTNMDSERPVNWAIGALANENTPEANNLIRQVILASASIPIAFQPVRISVTNGSDVKEELHVDGGLTQQVFVYPHRIKVGQILDDLGYGNRQKTIWLIHNKKLYSEFEAQNTRFSKIIARTLKILMKAQSLGDIGYIMTVANRDGISVNAITIPEDFEEESNEMFDPNYMSKLFEVGRSMANTGENWKKDVQRSLI